MPKRHVRREKPGHGASLQTPQISVSISPHGMQRSLSPGQKGRPRTRLSFPSAQMSFSRPVRFQRLARRRRSSLGVGTLSHASSSTTCRNSVLQSKGEFRFLIFHSSIFKKSKKLSLCETQSKTDGYSYFRNLIFYSSF